MAKKKAETPKLDATVKATHPGVKFKAPEYIKPYTDFHKYFPQGKVVTIWRRYFNENKQEWELRKMTVLITGRAINCFYYEDEDGRRKGCPWWGIHNFEFDGYPECKEGTVKTNGDDQFDI